MLLGLLAKIKCRITIAFSKVTLKAKKRSTAVSETTDTRPDYYGQQNSQPTWMEKIRYSRIAVQWWYTPLIPALGRQRRMDF